MARTTEEYDCPLTGDGLTVPTALRPRLPAGTDYSWDGAASGGRCPGVRVAGDEAKHAEVKKAGDVRPKAGTADVGGA